MSSKSRFNGKVSPKFAKKPSQQLVDNTLDAEADKQKYQAGQQDQKEIAKRQQEAQEFAKRRQLARKKAEQHWVEGNIAAFAEYNLAEREGKSERTLDRLYQNALYDYNQRNKDSYIQGYADKQGK